MDIRVFKPGLLGLLIVAFASSLDSCTSRKPAEDPTVIASILQKQSDNWDQAIIHKDENSIASNMAEDFRHIDKRGSISDKRTFVHEIMSDDLVIHPYTVEDFDIRIYGTCALLCGRTHMTGTYQGEPFQSHYRYIDTYSYSDGSWKIVSVQISPIPQQ